MAEDGSGDQSGQSVDDSGPWLSAADRRDDAGSRRDRIAEFRDDASEDRDRAADLRDRASNQKDELATHYVADNLRAADWTVADDLRVVRRNAAAERAEAWQDREAGAADRSQAGRDRAHSQRDRGAAAVDRRNAALDGLTGVYVRSIGLMELEREIARTRRTGESLVVAFIDVDSLKAINDSFGHAAGDQVLLRVANRVRAILRPYDLIIRYGGDEFLAVVTGLTTATARSRFASVNLLLAETGERGSVTVGIAQLQPGEETQELIDRADADLYLHRRRTR